MFKIDLNTCSFIPWMFSFIRDPEAEGDGANTEHYERNIR